MFSIFSGAIYSPYESLKIFFLRSNIFKAPFGNTIPISPLCNQPSSSRHSLVFAGSWKYPEKILGPLKPKIIEII